jgi:hypothetical protein
VCVFYAFGCKNYANEYYYLNTKQSKYKTDYQKFSIAILYLESFVIFDAENFEKDIRINYSLL